MPKDAAIRSIESFATGQWFAPGPGARTIASAITGAPIAEAGNDALPFADMLGWGRTVGGPALRRMTFHDRARMLKALALHLREHRPALYDLSYDTGATLSDHKIDVDGGIGTMLVFASKGRREMPDGHMYLDGPPEQLGKDGQFFGRHICVPLQGVAVHINAFNFPVWGMLEKLAPTWLAGMPAIVKPATATCYVTEACVRIMLESGILPEGALQLVTGGIGDMLDHVGCQDVVTFTGSAETALKLRANPNILRNSVRFTAEQDSLNASILGPDATPDTPEFELFLKEVTREMTAKAGQKCTAIRRIMVPDALVEPVIDGLKARLAKTTIGDPRLETTRMGALVSAAQKRDVLEKAALIGAEAERVFGDPEAFTIDGAEAQNGAFLPPMLYHCASPDTARRLHDTEAFGPVSTVMAYRDLDHAARLANRGQGSLVASVITHDPEVAWEIVLGAACFHGRIYINDRDSMAEATGHGSPLPHMVHGGPGRAGGGEELGGIRGVMHFMQRTAIQGSPEMLSRIGGQWVPGARTDTDKGHPFTRKFGDLAIGDTIHTDRRTVTLEDIEHFAEFTGDTFYAHMDDEAAAANPFFPGRVAHGYLLLSFAAGLFVQPDPGPVLANTGLDNLRFMKPVSPGDSIAVRLTVKAKTPRNDEYGEVRWHVSLTNQDGEMVAEYELLTMNAVDLTPLDVLTALPTPRVWSMLVTIFGDLAQAPKDRIDGPLLTRLTDGMGIRPEAVRVALHRLRNEDWITSVKTGRTSSHALTPRGRSESEAATRLIYAATEDLPSDWQIVLTETSEPELRAVMQAAGFAQLMPRVFVAHLGVSPPENTAVLRGGSVPGWMVEQAVPAELTAEFGALLAVLSRVSEAMDHHPAGDPLTVALLRCLVVHHWRRPVLRHPYLPPSLTGADWPGHLCRAEVAKLLARLPRPSLPELQVHLT